MYSIDRPPPPAAPPPPYASPAEMLRNSQLEFWSLNLTPPETAAPTEETEFLSKAGLDVAEADRAGDVGQDDEVVRIPLGQLVASVDLCLILNS